MSLVLLSSIQHVLSLNQLLPTHHPFSLVRVGTAKCERLATEDAVREATGQGGLVSGVFEPSGGFSTLFPPAELVADCTILRVQSCCNNLDCYNLGGTALS